MDAVAPAQITFAPEVRTILIVDRSGDRDRTMGVIEGILTGEVPDQDRAGLQAMVDSLREQLAWSGRFETRVAPGSLPGNSLTNVFPAPLEWSTVSALLEDHDADLLLSVEIFDSDFIVTRGHRTVKKTVTENNRTEERDVPEYYAEGVANLTIGLRLYDPVRRDIVDEELFNPTNRWQATGSNVRDAIVALIDKSDAAAQLSRAVGADYARRIAPMPTRVSRRFFGKSKRAPELELGGRHADVGHWREAAEVWERGIARAPAKEAGQLCYNVAIAHEVLGEWAEARKWAERAYVEYAVKEARGYLADLDRRVRREEIVAQQMP